LRQLSQRITARYHLRPLEPAETKAYINHRLNVAGLAPGRQPFPDAIIQRVHRISGGIPRLVNILCDRMLLGAYSKGVPTVDSEISQQAIVEVLGETPDDKTFNHEKIVIIGVAAAAGILGIVIVWLLISLLVSGPKQNSQEDEIHGPWRNCWACWGFPIKARFTLAGSPVKVVLSVKTSLRRLGMEFL